MAGQTLGRHIQNVYMVTPKSSMNQGKVQNNDVIVSPPHISLLDSTFHTHTNDTRQLEVKSTSVYGCEEVTLGRDSKCKNASTRSQSGMRSLVSTHDTCI